MPDKFRGMRITVARGTEGRVFLGLVAAQHQQVADAQELQVEQHVLCILTGISAAQDVRHDVYVIMPLDGSSHGYGAGTAADAEAFHDASS